MCAREVRFVMEDNERAKEKDKMFMVNEMKKVKPNRYPNFHPQRYLSLTYAFSSQKTERNESCLQQTVQE